MHRLIPLFLCLLISPAVAAEKQKKPLKLAVIAPVLEWDDVPEIKRLCDWMEGHYNLKMTWIQPEHPPHDQGKEAMKAYYKMHGEHAQFGFYKVSKDGKVQALAETDWKPPIGGAISSYHHPIFYPAVDGRVFLRQENGIYCWDIRK